MGRTTQAINANAEVMLQFEVFGQLIGDQTCIDEAMSELRHRFEMVE